MTHEIHMNNLLFKIAINTLIICVFPRSHGRSLSFKGFWGAVAVCMSVSVCGSMRLGVTITETHCSEGNPDINKHILCLDSFLRPSIVIFTWDRLSSEETSMLWMSQPRRESSNVPYSVFTHYYVLVWFHDKPSLNLWMRGVIVLLISSNREKKQALYSTETRCFHLGMCFVLLSQCSATALACRSGSSWTLQLPEPLFQSNTLIRSMDPKCAKTSL